MDASATWNQCFASKFQALRNAHVEDASDIVVNYLACQSSVAGESTKDVEKSLPELSFEKSYEYHFNLSQVYLKDGFT